MEWLVAHKKNVEFYKKSVECLNDKGDKMTLKGIKNLVIIKKISFLQMKICS